MKRWEELALRTLDGLVSDDEATEFQQCLRDAGIRAAWQRWLKLEAALRARRAHFDIRQATLDRLRAELRVPGGAAERTLPTEPDLEPGSEPVVTAASGATWSPLRLWGVAAALLALMALIGWQAAREIQHRHEAPRPTAPAVASGARPANWAIQSHPLWPKASAFRVWYFEPALGGPVMASSPDGEHWGEAQRLRGVRADTSELAVLFEPEQAVPFRLYYLAMASYCTEIRVAGSTNGIDFIEDQAAIRKLSYGARGLAVARLPDQALPYRLFYEDALSGRIVYGCSPDGSTYTGADFIQLEDTQSTHALRPLSVNRSVYGSWQLWVDNPMGDVGVLTSTNGLEWRFLAPQTFPRPPVTATVPPPLPVSTGSWDYFSPLDDWRAEGWLLFTTSGNTPDGETTAVLQQAEGTVRVRDLRPWGNFYLTHDTTWTVPFTVELRVWLDQAKGIDLDADYPKFTVAMMMRDPAVPGPQAWQPAFARERLGAWDLRSGPWLAIDTQAPHTFTLVCRFDPTVEQGLRHGATNLQYLRELCVFDVYVDRDFRTPAFSYHNTGFPGWGSVDADGRLDIGFPWASAGQLALDWVRWGNGVILDPADPAPSAPPRWVKRAPATRGPPDWQVANSPQGPWSDVPTLAFMAPPRAFGLARYYRLVPAEKPASPFTR